MDAAVKHWVASLDSMLQHTDLTYREWHVEHGCDYSLIDFDFEDEAIDFGYVHGQVSGWAQAHGLTVEQALDGAMPTLPMGKRYVVPNRAGNKVAELYYTHTPEGVSLDVHVTAMGQVPTAIAFPLDVDGHMCRGGCEGSRIEHGTDRMVVRESTHTHASVMCIDIEPAGSEPFGKA